VSEALVRLVIATDWDAGFQLNPDASPLPDIPPGEEYTTECFPQQTVMIRDVAVHSFVLVEISFGLSLGGPRPELVDHHYNDFRLYRLRPPLRVQAGARFGVRLRNDSDAPRKPKTAALVVDTGRSEDVVPCPACGRGPGDSCDGPRSHPSRITAHSTSSSVHVPQGRFEQELQRARDASAVPLPANWIVGGVKIDGVVVNPDPAINPNGAINFEVPALLKICPSCSSPDPAKRFGHRPAILIDGVPPPTTWCKDAWHSIPTPTQIVHRPRLARTMNEGPGNATRIRGCSCGATPMSPETFAEHVGVSVDGIRTMLNLVSLVYDLLDHHDHPKMSRENVMQQIERYLEFRP
jgi:hypothetical protein